MVEQARDVVAVLVATEWPGWWHYRLRNSNYRAKFYLGQILMTTGIRWSEEELAQARQRMAAVDARQTLHDAEQIKKTRKQSRQLEAADGRALIEWWDGNPRKGVPPACVRWDLEPDDLVHMPLGGARSKRAGAFLKAEGARAGYPDYLLDAPRGEHHGLRIELKHPDGAAPTPNQLKQLERLQKRGYCVAIAYGWAQASKVIKTYLNGETG